MTYSQNEIDMVKPYIESYLIGKGIDINRNFRCLDPEHGDKNPSMSYDKNNYVVHCFGCKKTYDIFGLIGLDYNLNNSDAFVKTMELYAPRQIVERKQPVKNKQQEKIKKDFSDKYKEWHNDLLANKQALNYILSRKIDKELIERFNLGFDKEHNTIVFPKTNFTYSARTIDKKQHFKQGESTIFNQSALSNDKNYCIITEGEFDCLSCESLGYNAIGLGGVSLINKFVESNPPKEKVYIVMLDNDDTGKTATTDLIHLLQARDLRCIAFDYTKPYKDPNECLTNDFEWFNKEIQGVVENAENLINEDEENARKEYEKESCLSKLEKLNQFIENTKDFIPYSTGFNSLDSILCGGLYSGLICLGAPSSTGKTTFALQIADNIAKNGQDVLFFSLEMPELELMCKSLSRLTFENKNDRLVPKNMNDILYGFHYPHYRENELKSIEASKEEYSKFASNLFIKECQSINVNQIREIIEQHIKIRKKKPVVFIDYLQIIAPVDTKQDIRMIVDYNVSELKRLAREFVIPIVAISSVNRQSYKDKMDMTAFKESGGIEFGADILLSLQFTNIGQKGFDLEEAKRSDPRKITLSVLKNRNGITGKGVYFEYKPVYNCFKESDEQAFDLKDTKSSERNQNIF